MCGKVIYYLCFLILVFNLVLSSAANAASKPIAWWKFDEGSGTTAYDSSGNGHDGTVLGTPEWGPGAEGFGGALNFSATMGTNCGDFDPTGGTGVFTLTLWCNWSGTSGTQHFFTKSNAWGADTMMFQVEVKAGDADPARTDRMALAYQAATQAILHVVPKNEWAHMALTFDGTNATGYLNGIDEAGPQPTGIGAYVNAPVLIGITWNGTRIFQGWLDDVRLYDRVLTPAEIRQVMTGMPPGAASESNPPDQATDVSRDVDLSWTPGEFAPAVNGHRVYFGENFRDVNDGVGGITVSASSYDPGRLDFETTYYWRVDEVNAPPDSTVYPGEVWSFTTEPVGYPIDGANVTATASSAGQADFGPQKTIDGSGLDENDLHSTNAEDMWLSGNEPQGAWIQYEFDKVYKLHQMWVWNSNQLFEGLYGFGVRDVIIEYSTNGADWAPLAGVPEFAKAPGTVDYAHNTTVDFGGVQAKVVKLTAISNWGGLLPQYGLSEVRFLAIPVSAREPSPDPGATDVDVNTTLTWRAGREAAIHNVYISSNQQAVIDGTVPAATITDTTYSPSALNLGTTYYWRVDEVNDTETPTTWQGDIWDFATQQFIVVEDFEDYNDYPPYEIYSTWLDGYENPANGSQVGYLTPPTVETTIVHGGKQSMPLIYSNTGGATYSEATRTFGVPQDWTRYGIQTLQLWFYGTAGNTGQLYAKINGVKVPYSGDPANLAVESWQPWDIDLTTVSVNLASVTSLAIGIDGNPPEADAGTLYVDDIRLH